MKNIILDGQTYSGISEVSLPISGGTALFKDKDEIIEPSGSVSITANGTYDVTDKASAVVNVPAPELNLQTKTATANGDVVADAGYDGLEKVIVAVSGDVPTLITKTIAENGTYNASADNADGYSSVTVNVPAPVLPTLTNPASAADILSGKEALDGDGAKLTGTCTFDADTSDADATASDIAEGKTAYVNGTKVVGTASGGGSSFEKIYTEDFDLAENYTSTTEGTIFTLSENIGSIVAAIPCVMYELVYNGNNRVTDYDFNHQVAVALNIGTSVFRWGSTIIRTNLNGEKFTFSNAKQIGVSAWLVDGTAIWAECSNNNVNAFPAGSYTLNIYRVGDIVV